MKHISSPTAEIAVSEYIIYAAVTS